jgi:DNA polymerase I-like protein with 3'-5' exonuclease and polymerase domains
MLKQQLSKQEEELLLAVKKETGEDVQIWAARSIAKAFDKLSLPYARTEKTDSPSFTKNFLSTHEHPMVKNIAKAREINKAHTTFIDTILKHQHRGRIHADINPIRSDQGGTVTGRLSYSHPNLQQLPNYSNVGMGIRSIFIPEEGCEWACFDYSQQEPRLVLHFASITPGMVGIGDMLDRYRSDEAPDFHSEIADITGLDRRQSKAISLGLFYGMGKAKLQAQLGINDDKKAQDILRSYDAKVPFVKRLIKQVMNRAQDRGKVRTLLGRSCRFNLWEPAQFGIHKPLPHDQAYTEYGPQIRRAFTYKALNKLIQGSAADMTKQAMVDLHSEGIIPEVQLHDELDISIDSDDKKKKIIEIMENAVKLDVPNKVDCEVGENWGSIEGEDDIDKNFF